MQKIGAIKLVRKEHAMIFLKKYLAFMLKRNGKFHFISCLDPTSKILDVGCGNNSPFNTKYILPRCHYTGIDICDHNQSRPKLADNYIITTSEKFSSSISQFTGVFDATISSHNLEHCEDRETVLLAMIDSLKAGGLIYLSFPCEESINFPNRKGTLNYYDDPTHKFSPPKFSQIIDLLKKNNFSIKFASNRYSPILLKIIGFFTEPISRSRKILMRGTWEYYGFESIIIARKMG